MSDPESRPPASPAPAAGRLLPRRPALGEIITGDVLAVLPTLKDRLKFDLVIADPPYNIGKEFGNDSDSRPLAEYVRWTRSWIGACLARLAPGGLIYIYGFHEILAHVAVQYPPASQRWLAWRYTNKSVPSSRFWQRTHEAILCLWPADQPRPRLEVDQMREPYSPSYVRQIGLRRHATKVRFSPDPKTTTYQDNGGALPRDVISTPALSGGTGHAERWFRCRSCDSAALPPTALPRHRTHDVLKHPTQKPMTLTRRLILSRLVPGAGGRLLIPFAGSGAECVAAEGLGVPYLGVELNPEYAAFARSWLAAIT